MATEDNPPKQRIVHHTAGSRFDLISVYQYNEVTYGKEHAERYLDFIDGQLSFLAEHPAAGHIVEQHPSIRVYTAKVRQRRAANGHRIFYRLIPEGIEIIRILHTAMNWTGYI